MIDYLDDAVELLKDGKPVIELPFETCPHCRYILDGLKIISNK
jgi:hypothetical protein